MCESKYRQESLRKYYANPRRCVYCGNVIEVRSGQKVSEVKKKKFCDNSCAAKYSNSLDVQRRHGPISLLMKCDDRDFVAAYNACSTCRELAIMLGYSASNSDISGGIHGTH